jgi:hypothetical protein
MGNLKDMAKCITLMELFLLANLNVELLKEMGILYGQMGLIIMEKWQIIWRTIVMVFINLILLDTKVE